MGDAAEAAKGAAGELAGAAKEAALSQARGFLDSNRHAAASQIGAMARALRNASSELEERQEPFARAASRAADNIERFSHALDSRDLTDALHAAQDYARRQPALFFGGAFLLGLAAARFLKASGERARPYRAYGTGDYDYDPIHPVATGAGVGSVPL
jgi:hypothetical protein